MDKLKSKTAFYIKTHSRLKNEISAFRSRLSSLSTTHTSKEIFNIKKNHYIPLCDQLVDIELKITEVVEEYPIYRKFLSKLNISSKEYALTIIYEIDDIRRFSNISKLWAYSGYSADPNRKVEFNVKLKKAVDKLTIELVETNRFYSALFQQYLEFEEKKGGTKIHIQNRAMRKTKKAFLYHLYSAWREEENLSKKEPYARMVEYGEI